MHKSLIKIGTRGSQLALYQAELVRSNLKNLFPQAEIEFVKIKTQGDIHQKGSFVSLGPGIFTREIENALLERKIDLAVHSAKDLATDLPKGLIIGAVLNREDVRDCLVSRDKKKLNELKKGACVGTSSLRRKAQLRILRPDLVLEDIRGNVDTRMKKIEQGEYDGMVLAFAGIKRLGLSQHVSEVFDPEEFLPQAGQGALAVEIREEDHEIKKMISSLNDIQAEQALSAERSFLRTFRGGCQLPAGIYSRMEQDQIWLKGAIYSASDNRCVIDSQSGPVSKGEQIGKELAEKILKAGGSEILQELK